MLRPPFQADIPAQVSNLVACAGVTSRYRQPRQPIVVDLIEFGGERASVGRSSYTYDGRDALRRLRMAKQQFEHVRKSLRIDEHDKRLGVPGPTGPIGWRAARHSPPSLRGRKSADYGRQTNPVKSVMTSVNG